MLAHNIMVNGEELFCTKPYPLLKMMFRKYRCRYNGVSIYKNVQPMRYFYYTQINKIRKECMTPFRYIKFWNNYNWFMEYILLLGTNIVHLVEG